MGPQRCCGYTEAGVSYGCCFNPMSKGGKAIAKKNGQCMVCSPSLMEHMCSSGLLRGNLIYHLSRIRKLCPDIFRDALRRAPSEWQCVLAPGLPKKHQFVTFSHLYAKICQNGCPNVRGNKSKKSYFCYSFSHWSRFGSPWLHFY